MMKTTLTLAFRDQSPSFAHGFICGKIWQQMREHSCKQFSEIIPAELREDAISFATSAGWIEEFSTLDESGEWLHVMFTRDGPQGLNRQQQLECKMRGGPCSPIYNRFWFWLLGSITLALGISWLR